MPQNLEPIIPHTALVAAHLRRPAILLLLLVAFFLRTYQLDTQALRGDEAATVLYAALPVTDLWELSRVTDPHPPLYYLMLHPWQWLVGESAWSMRLAGAAASTAAVAALYALAQRTLRSGSISLLAASLLAINPFQIWLAQDIRSYPFFALLGLLSAGALWWALHSNASRSPRLPWITYIVLTVACLYIHYYAVFLIAFQSLFVILNFRKFWPYKWPWLASQVAIALLIIPGLRLAYNFVGQAAGGIDAIPTSTILLRTSIALLTGFTIDIAWGAWLSLLLTPVWLAGLITLWRRNVTAGAFWALFMAVPVLGVIALSIDRPFFKERFFIQAQPAFEVLLAAGFLALWRAAPLRSTRPARAAVRAVTAGLLGLLLLANLVTFTNYQVDPVYAKAPPWQLYRDHVSHESRPGDVMLTNFPEAAVSYYSPNGLPFYVVPAERDRSVDFRVDQTEQIAQAYRRIWFLPLLRQGFDEQGDVLNWLDRHADRVDQIFLPGYNLNLYLAPPAIAETMISQPVTFAHGINLRGFQILDRQGDSRLEERDGELFLTVEPEDEFTLSLYWLAGGATKLPYTVFTHLIAADGFNRAGQDNPPVWGTYPTTGWQPGEKITDKYSLTLPPGAPAGDHRLRIGWYQSDTGEVVPLVDGNGQPISDHVILDVIVRVE